MRVLVTLAGICACLPGCASFKPTVLSGTMDSWYAVKSDQTAFYRYGPQQANGPDSELPRDSIMKVIRPSFGYVKVQLQDGENGYVASEDIAPAPAALVTAKLEPPPPPLPPEPTEDQFGLNSDDPRLNAPPEPLPEPTPIPEYRY